MSGRDAIAELRDRVAAELPPETVQVLDVGSDHSYSCTCATCLAWWAEMGPDGGEPGDYGPFTKERVNAEQRRRGLEVTP